MARIHSESVTTTIHDFPNELLCDIFNLIYDFQPDIKTPIGLSLVSVQWRNIAHSLPWLWADIRISAFDANVLRALLTRSKGFCLDIEVECRDPIPKGAMLGLWKSIILLASEMARCRRLVISAPSWVYKMIRDIFGNDGVAPLLESLELRCQEDLGMRPGEPDNECTFPAIGYNPDVLEHVSLDGVGLPFMDLSRVKALFLSNLHAAWLSPCLPPQNELEVLYLSNSSVPWGALFGSPALTHVILERQESSALLDAEWDTPALTHLTIVRPTPLFWGALMFLLMRHPQPARFAKVKRLTLVECGSSVMAQSLDVGTFVEALPGVEVIEFMGTSPGLIMDGLNAHPNAFQHLKTILVEGLEV